jgi:flagellar basal-body rod modification protein FlgD
VSVLPPTPISSLFEPKPATTTSPTSSLGKDAFLKLLVAQLKYQDPSSPTDSSQFMAQTAQFTQVEKLEEIAAAITQSVTAQAVFGANSLVGRTVSFLDMDGKTELSGVVTSASFTSAGPVLNIGTGDKQIGLGDITAVRSTPANPQ